MALSHDFYDFSVAEVSTELSTLKKLYKRANAPQKSGSGRRTEEIVKKYALAKELLDFFRNSTEKRDSLENFTEVNIYYIETVNTCI